MMENISQPTFNRMWPKEATSPRSQTGGLLAIVTFGFVGLEYIWVLGGEIVGAVKTLSQKFFPGSLLKEGQAQESTRYLS